MKYILLIGVLFVSLQAKVYYAKVEPIEKSIISSNVNGVVELVNLIVEGRFVTSKLVVKIDDYLEKKELESLNNKLGLIQKNRELNSLLKKNFEQIISRKQHNYDSIKDLSIKSKVEKDRDYFDLMASENQLINIKQNILNLDIQKNDIELRVATLQKVIKDKNLIISNKYIYNILVHKGEMVTAAKPLVEVYDTSKAKLTFYATNDEIEKIKNSVIYIDGKKTEYKIDKIWSIADSLHLSSYKVEIIIESVKEFSKLKSIEFKHE